MGKSGDDRNLMTASRQAFTELRHQEPRRIDVGRELDDGEEDAHFFAKQKNRGRRLALSKVEGSDVSREHEEREWSDILGYKMQRLSGNGKAKETKALQVRIADFHNQLECSGFVTVNPSCSLQVAMSPVSSNFEISRIFQEVTGPIFCRHH